MKLSDVEKQIHEYVKKNGDKEISGIEYSTTNRTIFSPSSPSKLILIDNDDEVEMQYKE